MADRVPASLRQTLDGLIDGQKPWPLYLHGPAGVGKTYGAYWALNQVPSSLYVRFYTLVDLAWDRDATLWHYVWQRMLIVIDEVGLRSSSDREYLALKRGADLREGKPTIWIGNLDPEELGKVYDERIVSRLCCGTVLRVTGPDQRMIPG